MEALLPDKFSNADKEVCGGTVFARTGDKEPIDSLLKLLGNG